MGVLQPLIVAKFDLAQMVILKIKQEKDSYVNSLELTGGKAENKWK